MAEAYLHIPVVRHTVRSVSKKRLLTVHLACFKEDVEISAQRSRVLKNLIREIHLACLLCVTKVRNVQAKLKDLTGEILWPDPSGSANHIPRISQPVQHTNPVGSAAVPAPVQRSPGVVVVREGSNPLEFHGLQR